MSNNHKEDRLHREIARSNTVSSKAESPPFIRAENPPCPLLSPLDCQTTLSLTPNKPTSRVFLLWGSTGENPAIEQSFSNSPSTIACPQLGIVNTGVKTPLK